MFDEPYYVDALEKLYVIKSLEYPEEASSGAARKTARPGIWDGYIQNHPFAALASKLDKVRDGFNQLKLNCERLEEALFDAREKFRSNVSYAVFVNAVNEVEKLTNLLDASSNALGGFQQAVNKDRYQSVSPHFISPSDPRHAYHNYQGPVNHVDPKHLYMQEDTRFLRGHTGSMHEFLDAVRQKTHNVKDGICITIRRDSKRILEAARDKIVSSSAMDSWDVV